MGDPIPPIPNPNTPQSPPSSLPPPATAPLPPSSGRRFFSVPRPAIRVTSEFDSDSSVFFHKVSCQLFDRLAKLKLSFQNDPSGEIAFPQFGFLTKHFAVLYDLESRNALLRGSFDLANFLQVRATHDVKTDQIGEPDYLHIGCSTQCLSISCTFENSKSVLSCIHLGSCFLLKYHHRKEQQGEVAMVASLANPSYKLELSSLVPSVGLPRATIHFPLGEVSVEEKKTEEVENVLSVNGILKSHMLNGVCTALYKDNDLNLRYCYKDEEMSFIPSVSLPSNALSFAFKRRFSPSDKLSYWYHFDSSEWSTVYKHTIGKDLKFKAGYDSGVRLGWASLWVGEEEGKTKTAPMKMKVQFMLQVPQDDIGNSIFMFRVKKRWDF
ncbi:outer envelope pore protein 37, chloroplastic isoform X1 [Elaeis guineensis]|uniref:Outer envelope pore protein 37, chloroplastic isoform X2 n=1 Tax=Elaeis guineensis var. tenera TaxID=51953 RepID=A0A6I9RPF5_ELAGV|nr:outer envelope pore protein 37, chloroplastic isoform X2 [Elaeis guineensis]